MKQTAINEIDKLKHVLRVGGLGVWELDYSTGLSYWNEETFHIFGMKPNDTPIPFDKLEARIHPDDRPMVRRAVMEGAHQPIDVQYRVVLNDGRVRYVHSKAAENPHGESNYLYGIIQDITDQVMLEKQLKEKTQRYESLKRYNPDGICSVDIAGRIMGANPALEVLTGYSHEELLNMSYLHLVFEKDADYAYEQLSLGSHRGHKFCLTIRHKDGHRVETESTSVPMVIDHQVQGAYLIVQDVSLVNEQQRRLRDIEARHQLISDNSQDIISYSTVDGRCEYVSPAIRKLGYEPEELVGYTTYGFYHPDDIPHMLKIGAQMNRGADAARFDCRVRCKDGQYTWIETTVKAIRDEHGQIVRVLAIGRDISRRKQMEEALIRSEENLKQAQHLAHFGHWEWDLESDTTNWSDEVYAICGLDECPGDGSRISLLDFVHPDDCDEASQWIAKIMEGHGARTEFRIVRPDGVIRILENIGNVTRNSDGTPVRVFGTLRDVTEEKRTEEMLLKSEKLSAVGQLAAGIAHEIRNPLTALKGFSQLLRARSRGDKRRYFDIMQSELNRIDMILGELLVLAKPQAVLYQPKEVALILQEVIALLGTQAILNNVVIMTEFGPDVPWVECEENQLKQVFVNIIKNAVEAMPSGGRLFVRLHSDAHSVIIEFEDEGEGMPPEQLARLGEPFYTTKSKGTGLGVMVSYKIISAHKGTMEYARGAERGTIVRVALPASNQQPCDEETLD